jgi:hypothetical protein
LTAWLDFLYCSGVQTTAHLRSGLVLVMLLVGGQSPSSTAQAAEPAGATGVASLADRLAAGLRARLPHEKHFVTEVVALVHAGRLPQKLVDSTYLWAVQRRQAYPFPAFEHALRIQANQLGVAL